MLIVVKIGGSTLEEGLPQNFISDIVELASGNEIVVIHGGGKTVTKIASKLGKEQRFIVSPEGFRSRYTDKETVEIFTMVMTGKINKDIVINLQKRGLNAIGLSGLDSSLVLAKRKEKLIIVDERGRKRAIEGGYTGKITKVNMDLLKLLLKGGYIPIISPVAMGEKFEPLNIDGDRMAAYIAGSINADVLVLLTDVEGLKIDGKTVRNLSLIDAKESLEKIGHGMITKVYAAMEAIDLGAKSVIISSGLIEHPIVLPVKHETGTVIEP